PHPTPADNTTRPTTSLVEPPINVSAPIRVKGPPFGPIQVATFTHANGVEPVNAFVATINWGDGTTSTGTITLSGTTYSVAGSHVYGNQGYHTITTTVAETGSSPVGGDKFGDERPGDDVVRLTQDSKGSSGQGASSIQASNVTPTLPGGGEFLVSFMPVTQQG